MLFRRTVSPLAKQLFEVSLVSLSNIKRKLNINMQDATITLNENEANAFDILRKTNEHYKLNSVMRAAGGWVRDKILGKSSDDIDIAVDNMTGEDFVNKVKEYVETVHNV